MKYIKKKHSWDINAHTDAKILHSPVSGTQRVWFLSCFGLKTSIDFEHFGLKLGVVIGGMFTKAYNLIFLPSDRGE